MKFYKNMSKHVGDPAEQALANFCYAMKFHDPAGAALYLLDVVRALEGTGAPAISLLCMLASTTQGARLVSATHEDGAKCHLVVPPRTRDVGPVLAMVIEPQEFVLGSILDEYRITDVAPTGYQRLRAR